MTGVQTCALPIYEYIFGTLRAFGFGDGFLSWVELLYTGASCMIKAGGGLSVPVLVSRGIRQGCPLSGQLYSLAVDPFLCLLKKKLSSLQFQGSSVKLSAYADDISLVIRHEHDVHSL